MYHHSVPTSAVTTTLLVVHQLNPICDVGQHFQDSVGASPRSVEFWAASFWNSWEVEPHQVSWLVAPAGCFSVIILFLVSLCGSQVVSYQLVGFLQAFT